MTAIERRARGRGGCDVGIEILAPEDFPRACVSDARAARVVAAVADRGAGSSTPDVVSVD